MDPVTIAILGGSVLGGAWSAWEARKNRKFQEKMSSTAHQREAADLKAAGLNPILSANRGGASSPGGSVGQVPDLGQAAGSALRARAELGLINAQTNKADADARLTNTEASTRQLEQEFGYWERYTANTATIKSESDLRAAQARLAEMDVSQREKLFPIALAQAKAQIEQTLSSAQAAKMRAELDRLEQGRAINIDEFERRLGQSTPAVRFLIELMRGLPGGVIPKPLPR